MRASTLNILDSLEAPLLDYIAGYEAESGAAAAQRAPAPQPPQRQAQEKPASSLDSKGLLSIFGAFLRPGSHG